MGTTDSRPRVRLTHATYLLVLAVVAASDGRAIYGAAALAAHAAGFALVAVAVLGRLWTTLFIAGRKGVELVVDGPYSASRHPLYSWSIVAALGVGLSTCSLVLTFALPAAIGLGAAFAARREDAALLLSHDAAWRGYRDSVPAFWPALSLNDLPDRVEVPPRIYWRAFLDAASFLLLWLFVMLLDGLRAGGAWESLFQLP
jgi:protein-S-isoprenylcysteine O-methyltransferase Ste14